MKSTGSQKFPTRVTAAWMIAVSLVAGGAAAVSTTRFGYDGTLGQYQSGSDAPSAGAELFAGVARLKTRGTWDRNGDPDWYLESGFDRDAWKYRMPVTIGNANATPLQEYQVKVTFGAAGSGFWAGVGSSATAVRFTSSDGTTRVPHWTESFDPGGKTAAFWTKIPNLPQGNWTGFLYFGWQGSGDPPPDLGDEVEVFSYLDARRAAYILSERAAAGGLDVTGYAVGNYLRIDGFVSPLFDPGTVVRVPESSVEPGAQVLTHGPLSAGFDAEGTNNLVPMAFQGTEFVLVNDGPSNEASRQSFIAPHVKTEVSVYSENRNNRVDEFTLDPDSIQERTPEIENGGTEIIIADAPILVEYATDEGSRARPVFPATDELFGIPSSRALIVAYQDDTRVNVYRSDDTSESFVLDEGGSKVLAFEGPQNEQGGAPAFHAVATINGTSMPAMIGGHQADAGDGNHATTFLPTSELSRTYYVPREAQYITIAAIEPATTCSLKHGSAPVPAVAPPLQQNPQTSGALARPYPNKILFGWQSYEPVPGNPTTACADFPAGARIPAGSVLSCDKPVFAYYEDCRYDEERNLFGARQNRQRARFDPSVSFGELQTVYLPGGREYVDSPAFHPAGGPEYGVAKLLAFYETAAKPAGTLITYQVSDGADFRYWDGAAWAPASANLANASSAADLSANAPAYDTSGNTVVLRAILASTDGMESPLLDAAAFDYNPLGALDHFVVGPVASPQKAGIPFDMKITAFDRNDFVFTPFSENACDGEACRVSLTDSTGTMSPAESAAFTRGARVEPVTVCEAAKSDVVTVSYEGFVASSAAFDVEAGDPATLVKLQGDAQTANAGSTLPVELAVSVRDICGNAVAGAAVTFSIASADLRGDGTIDGVPGPVTKLSDNSGRAGITMSLDTMAGVNTVVAAVAGAPAVTFSETGLSGPDEHADGGANDDGATDGGEPDSRSDAATPGSDADGGEASGADGGGGQPDARTAEEAPAPGLAVVSGGCSCSTVMLQSAPAPR